MGQCFVASHVQLVQFAFNTQTTFIEVGDIGGDDLLLDTFQTELGLFNHLLIGGDDDSFRKRLSIEIAQQFFCPCQGNEVIIVQVAAAGALSLSGHTAWVA